MFGVARDSAGASSERNSSRWRRAGKSNESWILVKPYGRERERERGRVGGRGRRRGRR